jgi:hypothetical protein
MAVLAAQRKHLGHAAPSVRYYLSYIVKLEFDSKSTIVVLLKLAVLANFHPQRERIDVSITGARGAIATKDQRFAGHQSDIDRHID